MRERERERERESERERERERTRERESERKRVNKREGHSVCVRVYLRGCHFEREKVGEGERECVCM